MPPPPVIVIYAGRFQPFHNGHLQAYRFLCKTFSEESVHIATSNKTGPTSPFDFRDRLVMVMSHDIPGGKVIESSNPYLISKTVKVKWPDIDLANHRVIIAVGLKDMEDTNPRFSFKLTKTGTPKYFQPFTSLNRCDTADKHAYVLCAPTFRFIPLNEAVESATEIRELYANSSSKIRNELISSLYPTADLKMSYLLRHSFNKLA